MNINNTPLLIAIDDQKFYLEEIAYEIYGKNVDYKSFEGPSAFEEDVTEDDINRAKLIFIDYDFGMCTAVDRDLVGYIRSNYPGFKGKIVLLSLLEDFLQDNKIIHQGFDRVLNKQNLSWDHIQALMN